VTIVCLPIDASAGSPSYTAQQTRQAFSALSANGTARPLGAQSGIAAGAIPVMTASSTTWSVGAGSFIIDAAFTTTQAPYLVSNDAAVTGSVTAANASYGRYDILYVQISDTAIDGSGSRNAQILYLAGTAASSPVAPATPARSLLLATIFVPVSGGGAPTLSLNPVFTVANGGLLPVANSTNRGTLITNPYDGMPIYRQDTNRIEIYNGSSWDTFSSNQRTGATMLLGDSWSTQGVRSHSATWTTGESVNCTVANSATPITIVTPGLYSISLNAANSAVMTTSTRSYVSVILGGTLPISGSKTEYRFPMQVGELMLGDGFTVPLAAGNTLNVTSFLNSAAYSLTATLSCYKVGD
jgi:hypothetical protein